MRERALLLVLGALLLFSKGGAQVREPLPENCYPQILKVLKSMHEGSLKVEDCILESGEVFPINSGVIFSGIRRLAPFDRFKIRANLVVFDDSEYVFEAPSWSSSFIDLKIKLRGESDVRDFRAWAYFKGDPPYYAAAYLKAVPDYKFDGYGDHTTTSYNVGIFNRGLKENYKDLYLYFLSHRDDRDRILREIANFSAISHDCQSSFNCEFEDDTKNGAPFNTGHSGRECPVFDIPCNFNKLFVPRKGFLEDHLKFKEKSPDLHFPLKVVDEINMLDLMGNASFVCIGPKFVGCGGPVDVLPSINFRFIQFPPAFLRIVRFVTFWSIFLYFIDWLGLPVIKRWAAVK